MMEKIDPVYVHSFEDVEYSIAVQTLQERLRVGEYDELYLMDMSENADGTVLISVNKDSGDIYNAKDGDLGGRPRIGIQDTKAADAIRGGQPGDIRFDIIYGNDGTPYYAGYMLAACKDEHRYTLCVLFNWSEFRQTLYTNIFFSILISAVFMITANILLIRFLYIKAVRPVAAIQKSVRGYTETKDIARITGELSAIKTKNEFGALAGDVSQLVEEIERYTAESARIFAELDLAANIQLSALPSKFPAFPDRKEFDLFASMTPAKEVGGDFYDFFLIGEDKLALVIADVSGKGVPAALFMMSSKIFIENYAQSGGPSAAIISTVNDRVCLNNEDMMFVTVWLGILDIGTGKLTCCNAGHETPALRKADGRFELINDVHDTAVGVMKGMPFNEYEIRLDPGDTIFVYTDGVPEATDSNEKLFGEERMIEALNSVHDVSPEELLIAVKSGVDAFVGDAPQFDDLTMLALRYSGSGGGGRAAP